MEVISSITFYLLPAIIISWLSFGEKVDYYSSTGDTSSLTTETIQKIEELQLTDEQKEKIRSLENKYYQKIEQLNREIERQEKEFAELSTGNASTKEVRDKYEELQAIKTEASQVYFDKFLALREVMTPNQRRQLTY